jgi:hypothetical protein
MTFEELLALDDDALNHLIEAYVYERHWTVYSEGSSLVFKMKKY